MAAVSQPPEYPYLEGLGSPTGSQVPSPSTKRSGSSSSLSPPLVAMIAVVSTAFLIVLYARLLSRPLRRLQSRWRRWHRRRRRMALSAADLDGASPPRNPGWGGDYAYYYYYNSSSGPLNQFLYSPYGLDEAAIKGLPVCLFTAAATKSDVGKKHHHPRECAVCLLEFEDGDWVRTLPLCSHAFHADCIDVWLRSHANCPLCRAAIFQGQQQADGGGMRWSSAAPTTFAPMRAARIRPSFDEFLLNPPPLPSLPEREAASVSDRGIPQQEESEIVALTEPSPPRGDGGEDDEYEERQPGGNLLLSRSYSFGFERNLGGDDRIGSSSLAATTPWRYPRGGGGSRSSFWSKRWPSPLAGGVAADRSSEQLGSAGGGPRVFSFRSYLGSYLRSSPLFPRGRRPGSSFLPLSESRAGVGSHNNPTTSSSRRTRSMTMLSSPAFFPHAAAGGSSRGGWGWGGPASSSSSSRHRCGDPEALLSPDRLNSSVGGANGR